MAEILQQIDRLICFYWYIWIGPPSPGVMQFCASFTVTRWDISWGGGKCFSGHPAYRATEWGQGCSGGRICVWWCWLEPHGAQGNMKGQSIVIIYHFSREASGRFHRCWYFGSLQCNRNCTDPHASHEYSDVLWKGACGTHMCVYIYTCIYICK